MNKLVILSICAVLSANCSNQASRFAANCSNQASGSSPRQLLLSAIESGIEDYVEGVLMSQSVDLTAPLYYNQQPLTFLYLVAMQKRFNPGMFNAIAARLTLADLQQQLTYSPGNGLMPINDLLKNDKDARALINRLLEVKKFFIDFCRDILKL